MKIKLKVYYRYNVASFVGGCEASNALLTLLKRPLKASELPLLGKIGFEIEYEGDKRELEREMKRENIL